MFILIGSMASFCYSYFSTFMSFGQFLLFVFVLFLFESSVHPPSVFVFSFSLHTFRSSLLLYLVFDLYVSSTTVTLCCCFFVQLSLSVYYCVIILRTCLYHYRQPHNTQNATTDISAVELSVSVMHLLAN